MPNWTNEQFVAYEHKRRAGVGAVEAGQREQGPKPALDRKPPKKHRSQRSVVLRCSIITCGHRLLDSDNAIAGCKPIRDAIAKMFGIDDGDPRIQWEYGQCHTSGTEGVMIKLERFGA